MTIYLSRGFLLDPGAALPRRILCGQLKREVEDHCTWLIDLRRVSANHYSTWARQSWRRAFLFSSTWISILRVLWRWNPPRIRWLHWRGEEASESTIPASTSSNEDRPRLICLASALFVGFVFLLGFDSSSDAWSAGIGLSGVVRQMK